MQMFDLFALAKEHRADREREAWLERRRPRPVESETPRAPTACDAAGAGRCPADRATPRHAPAA